MFKLVVLFAFFAIAAAKPSGVLTTYAAVATPAIAVPAAVSHQYRTDVISKPVVATYAAPIVEKTVVAAAPAVVAAPTVVATPAISAAVTHQSRVDYHPTIVASAPLAYAAHAPILHAW